MSDQAFHQLCPDLDRSPQVVAPAALRQLDLREGKRLQLSAAAPWIFDVACAVADLPHWIGDRLPLVSAKLIAILRAAGVDNFQALPAALRCEGTDELCSGYVVFNVLGLVDAADASASQAEEWMESPRRRRYSKLVLARSRTADLDMFRLADSPDCLLVHDRVKRALWSDPPREGWGLTPIEIELRK